ncbi:MAG TPA: DUF1559 domain-containing protein [Gemmatales bacterium]|nr:DUF1559 domain-containing protein [Gemmatales bacterium]
MRKNSPRSAFSLIELLVVVAIMGTLMALLLPAVQRVRAAADSMVTASNLRQIGIALHAFHHDYGRLPPGYEGDSTHPDRDPETFDGPNGWAWGSFLLRYLEADPLHRQINFDLPCWHPANAHMVSRSLKVFLNPAAPNYEPTFEVKDEAGNVLAVFATAHFAANAGTDEPWAYAIEDHGTVADGPFYRNSRVRLADILDGTSHTVFIGEHSVISNKTWVGVVPGASVAPINPGRFPFTEPDAAATLVLVHSGPAPGELDTIHPPNYPTCHVCQMYSPFQGANVLFGDNSVRFISPRINVNVWAAMATINRGELIDDSDF